ncbi:MAG: ThiF family adenylyltransferase [Planctomycetota bacterium]
MPDSAVFDYREAFSRNLGLVTEAEQEKLRRATVGLVGMGGVGGGHVQAIARMGVEGFHLSDLDVFEVANFNRQFGAFLWSVGRPKAEVCGEILRNINPNARVKLFAEGITRENIGNFLDGVDIVVDGIDFFCIRERLFYFAACRERGIPVVTAGPIGHGAAVLVFVPGGMTFEEYFRIDPGMTRIEMLLAFGLGLGLRPGGGMDPARVDFERGKGPALAPVCFLCSALAGMEVLKIILGRGPVAVAPRGRYHDIYRGSVRPLRRPPLLTRSLRGWFIRKMIFRMFPQARRLHEAEIAARGSGVPG